jgi:hypothetical protein
LVGYVKSNSSTAFEKYKINWGNLTASMRYTKPIGQKVFLKNTLAYSSYDYGLGSSLVDEDKNKDFFKSKSTLTDLMLKSTFEIYPNSKSEMFLGGELTSHFYKPVNISSTYEINVPRNNDRIKAIETALFSEFNTQITPWFSLQAGLRYASFSVQDTV